MSSIFIQVYISNTKTLRLKVISDTLNQYFNSICRCYTASKRKWK